MKRSGMISFILMLIVCLIPGMLRGDELKSEDLYKQALPSIMTVFAENKDGNGSQGTAFLISDTGIAVTAWHVIDKAKAVTVRFSDGEEFEASGLIDKDEKRDIALIRVKVFGRKAIKLAKDEPVVGSTAYVIGAPRGLEFSISGGLISQVRIMDGFKQYQYTSASSPGNSGGPLLNSSGEVLGVVDSGRIDGQNLNFAVPSTYVLGLDASLPTTPWDKVKCDKPKTEAEKEEDLDKLLARAFILAFDSISVINYAGSEAARKPLGASPPMIFYLTQNDLDLTLVELTAPTTIELITDENRLDLTKRVAEIIVIFSKAFTSLRRAIVVSEIKNCWRGAASDLYNHSSSLQASGIDKLLECGESISILDKSSETFSNLIPKDLKIILGLITDASGIVLDVAFVLNEPFHILSLDPDGFGYKLGLRKDDRIISANGTVFTPDDALEDFKKILNNNLGKKIEVVVLRKDKEKTLKMKIPKEIPEKYLSQLARD